MTVRMMIRQLVMFPMDSQVLDTEGSPIMYMTYHSRDDDSVRLEPKSQMDVDAELDATFQTAMEEAWTDYDTWDDLCERGFTLEDLKNYRESVYEWALRMEREI